MEHPYQRFCMRCFQPLGEGVKFCSHCSFREEVYEEPSFALPLRTVISNKYLIGEIIGSGGFGITYNALDIPTNKQLAIKEYFPSALVQRDSAQSLEARPISADTARIYHDDLAVFDAEAKVLVGLRDIPNIVKAKDYFAENNTAYLVMEYVQGETLKDHLLHYPEGRMPEDQLMKMVRPLIYAISRVHAAGIIHRDISPDNIVITPENQLKLLDFGAAYAYISDDQNRRLIYKPGYSPPEQLIPGRQLNASSDVYALCATMYRALCGVTPPDAETRWLNDTLDGFFGASVSPRLASVLMTGLRMDQQARYQTMDELYRALTATAAEAVTQPGTGAPASGERSVSVAGSAYHRTVMMGRDVPGEKTLSLEAPPPMPTPVYQPAPPAPAAKKGKFVVAIAIMGGAVVGLAALCLYVVFSSSRGTTPPSLSFVQDSSLSSVADSEVGEDATENSFVYDAPVYEDFDESTVIDWADPAFEKLVRTELGRSEGAITVGELRNIYEVTIVGNRLYFAPAAAAIFSDENGNAYPLVNLVEERGTVRSMEDLRYFMGLVELNVIANPVDDLDVLTQLPNINRLQVVDCNIRSIEAVGTLQHLNYLDLAGNAISDISPLANLSGLQVASLGRNLISDISPLAGNQSLYALYLANNQIEDISPLATLTEITQLQLNNNQIQSIAPLVSLTAVEYLDLADNQISDVSALSGLTSVEYLFLQANRITSVEGLAGLTHCVELNLYSNSISDISPLAGLESLYQLNLWNNMVSDPTPLTALANLRILIVAENPLADLTPLTGMQLEYCDVLEAAAGG